LLEKFKNIVFPNYQLTAPNNLANSRQAKVISILKKVNKNHKYNMIKRTDQEIARLIQEVIRWVEVVLISLVAIRKMSEILMD